MWKKIKDIVKLIKAAGKSGIIILCFFLFKTLVNQLKDCGITVLIPALIINAYENNQYNKLIYIVISFFSVIFFLSLILNRIEDICMCKQYADVSKKITSEIFKKISNSDISRFDDASFYEKHILNINNIEEKIFEAIINVAMMLSCIFIFFLNFSLIIVVSGKTWLFVLLALVATIILQFLQTRFNLAYQKKALSLNRRAEVLGHFFMDYDYAKEIKNPKRAKMLFEQVLQEKEMALELFYKSRLKFIGFSFGKLFASTFFLKVIFLAYLTFRCLLYKEYSYAGILLAYNASINLFGVLNNFVTMLSKYDDIALYAEHYNEIMVYKNEIVSGKKVLDHFENLEFRNVSFRYTGMDENVLNGVTFKINQGQKVALVGRNGNGKSSLIKLLLRLYEPQSGEIFVNSINIKEYDIESYRNFFGVLFQDSSMFNATIEENIYFGHKNDVKLFEVLSNVGIYDRIEKLENKEKTEYGVDIFEHGVIFSGGEQQRLLVARALAKNAEMIIMDEPTSHIDPAADISFSSMVFNNLTEKTVLYITHRLISTKKADCIIVLNNEGSIEKGSHSELMLNSELYRKMYEAQEKSYTTITC